MSLFSSLRGARPSPSSSDEKDHDSDREEATTTSLSPSHTPLLLDPNNSGNNITSGGGDSDSPTFPLRIKLNDGKSTIDFLLDDVLPNVTVRKLKERILSCHFDPEEPNSNNGATGNGGTGTGSPRNPSLQSPSRRNNNNNGNNNNNRYLRLIVRGRMMAPDTSQLDTFSIAANDVIHAVLAKEGARGGQQARMLKRLNHEGRGTGGGAVVGAGSGGNNGGANNGGAIGAGVSPSTRTRESIEQSLWRRIGIDANGVVISSNNENEDSDEEESEEEDFEDAHGEIDLEMGHTQQHGRQQRAVDGGEGSGGGSTRRRRRERRGFDRLRATGMTRDEVTTIRIYFSRSVDRYIERRRVMIRASQRLRESLSEIANTGIGGRAGAGVGASSSSPRSGGAGDGGSSPSTSRRRSNTGESSNSLLEDELNNNAAAAEGSTSVNGNDNARRGGGTQEGGNTNTTTNDDSNGSSGGGGANSNNNAESANESSFTGEEILNDRLRMEDEWMSTQGPYSEFRMNLNTSNPLLLAAISGGGNGVGTLATTTPTLPEMGPAGLFFRSRNNTNGLDSGPDDDEDEMFGGAFTPNGTFLRNPNGSTNGGNGYHPYMGPLPSAGTDKDFIWGFILGFFVGFIMLFWVWMPTVPHKQKIGIMVGISFQLGLNLLRKSGEAGVAIGSV